MPLTEKGQKIKSAMERQYGKEKGEEVFYRSRNKGTITGVDDANLHLAPHLKGTITHLRDDDNTHMGFTNRGASEVGAFVEKLDALEQRMDAFEQRKHQGQPEKVKPRTKDFMQPSNPHPKEV